MARPLVIGPEESERIQSLIVYAQKNPYTIEKLKMIKRGLEIPPGDRQGFSIELPFGFRCVFTIEDHPMGTCRHLSISVNSRDKYPAPKQLK